MEELTEQQKNYDVPFYYCGMLNTISDNEKCYLENLPRHKKIVYKKVFEKLIVNLEELLKLD